MSWGWIPAAITAAGTLFGSKDKDQQQIQTSAPAKTAEQIAIDKALGARWADELANPFKYNLQDPMANNSSYTIGGKSPAYVNRGNFGMAPYQGSPGGQQTGNQRSLSTPRPQQKSNDVPPGPAQNTSNFKPSMTPAVAQANPRNQQIWAIEQELMRRNNAQAPQGYGIPGYPQQDGRSTATSRMNMPSGWTPTASNPTPQMALTNPEAFSGQNQSAYQPGQTFDLEDPRNNIGQFRQQNYTALGNQSPYSRDDYNSMLAVMQQKADSLGVPLEALPEMKSQVMGPVTSAKEEAAGVYWQNLMNGGGNIQEGLSKDYETKYKQNYQDLATRNYAVNDLERKRQMNKLGVPISAQVASNSAQMRQQDEADRAAMNNLFMTNEQQAKADQQFNLGTRNTGASNYQGLGTTQANRQMNVDQFNIGNNRSDQAANIQSNIWKQEGDKRNAALGLGQMNTNYANQQGLDANALNLAQYNQSNQMNYDQANEARRQALEAQRQSASSLYNTLVGQQKSDYDQRMQSAANTRNSETGLNRNDYNNTATAAGNWAGNMTNQQTQAQLMQNNAIAQNNNLAALQNQQNQQMWNGLAQGANQLYNTYQNKSAANQPANNAASASLPSYLSSYLNGDVAGLAKGAYNWFTS